jgi:hypothetical protein
MIRQTPARAYILEHTHCERRPDHRQNNYHDRHYYTGTIPDRLVRRGLNFHLDNCTDLYVMGFDHRRRRRPPRTDPNWIDYPSARVDLGS